MKLIVATRNPHKQAEIYSLLKDMVKRFTVLSAAEVPDLGQIAETGTTLRQNALIKAVGTAAVVAKTFFAEPFIVMADDSGLEVDALNAAPGVMSARFAGDNADYHANNLKLLRLLEDIPDERRTAHFRCVIALAESRGVHHLIEGVCRGKIGFEERGSHGFGYDPLFLPDGYDKTFAQMSPEEKNRISHRAAALAGTRELLRVLG